MIATTVDEYRDALAARHLACEAHRQIVRDAMTSAVKIIAKHLGGSRSSVRRSVRHIDNALAVLDRLGYSEQATDLRFRISVSAAAKQATTTEGEQI